MTNVAAVVRFDCVKGLNEGIFRPTCEYFPSKNINSVQVMMPYESIANYYEFLSMDFKTYKQLDKCHVIVQRYL